jgi:hypothetical protein
MKLIIMLNVEIFSNKIFITVIIFLLKKTAHFSIRNRKT